MLELNRIFAVYDAKVSCQQNPVQEKRLVSQVANSMLASSSRPLRLRLRPDIKFTRQQYQGRDYWVAKDPIALRFYRFEEEEYALLQLLDGQSSAEQIKNRFEAKFAPQKLTYGELFQFVGMLYRQSMLISGASRQGQELLHRGIETEKRTRRAALTNILSVRFKGIDPRAILETLNYWFGWFFSIPMLTINLILMLSALALIFTQFEYFQSRLPDMHSFFAAKNWIWLGIILGVTKVIHELGHGISCRRFGGQCHEMGVMFLVLMPCLYCNVSDSWMIRSKWKRMSIAAAGIYIELVLASLATFVWWFSQPGLINNLALNVMFVSSVSTLLFNANPLLRYDGYYILSDWLEVPNLRQKASKVLQRFFSGLCLGLPTIDDPFMPHNRQLFFASYSVAAALYKWVITFSIFWFLYQLLEPYGLKILSQLLAMMALYGLIGMPLKQAYRFFSAPGRIQAVKPARLVITLSVVAAITIAILMIPTPHRISCSFYVQPQQANRTYVEYPGRLSEIYVKENQFVQAGQEIARLESREHQLMVEDLKGEVTRAKTRYNHALRRGNVDSDAANDIEYTLAVYKTLQTQLDQREDDVKKLTIRAPSSGTFIFGSYKKKKTAEETGTLDYWHGHALDRKNIGAILDQGTELGQVVVDPRAMEAILVMDQSDAEFIKSGQNVDLWARQHFNKFFKSQINQISPSRMKNIPNSLSSNHGGNVQTRTGSQGQELPVSATYQVSVPFDNSEMFVQTGSTGVARVHVGQITIGQRLWRLAMRTFRFEL